MATNPFDSDDPTLTDVRTRVPGPAGSLPFTPEMLRERPSGDLFGWSQNAGMGWDPSAIGGREFLMLSTHGGIRAADGTPIALGYHTGHWEVGLLMEAAAAAFKSSGAVPFAASCTDPCDGRSQGTTAMPRETRLNRDENIHCGSDVWRVIPSMRRGSASITRATSTFRARASQASTRREGKDQMRTTTSVAVALALAVMLPGSGAEAFRTTVQAQSAPTSGTDAINPALLAGLKWRSIGPARGGRSQAVAGSSSRPFEYYFGATGGGLWKTTDGGVTWRPVSDKSFEASSVGAVAVAESNPDVVYVGMGETELRGNIIQGDGVYKSTDGGKTFTRVGLEKTLAISRIRIHPTNSDIVYVAALGDPYGPNADRGIFKTTDGGKSWTKSLFRNDNTGAVDLSMDPAHPDVLYAGLWEVYRTPHSLSSGGAGSGLFKTTDGGATWTELTSRPGLPKPVWGKIGVSVSGADANRVYAIIEAAEGGVFLSDDGGGTWTRVNDDRRLRQRAFYYTRIYADPQAKDTVYVLNTGIYRSTDAGKTIRGIRVPHGDNHDLWIAANDPKRIINSNDGGANVSVNAGESWTNQNFPTAQFYNVFTTAHVPYHVCGAQQDNSTACVSSTGDGTLYDVGGGESGYIAPDPEDTDVFYAGSYGGLLTRINRRTGETRAINVWPDNPMGFSSSDITERFQWTYPIVIAPTDPNTLYATSQHVWRSTNEGQSWQRISPDLTRHDPSTMMGSLTGGNVARRGPARPCGWRGRRRRARCCREARATARARPGAVPNGLPPARRRSSS